MTDNTSNQSNNKMKGSKMWKIRMSMGYSKKRCAYANFLLHVRPSRDSTDKSFKRFEAYGQLLSQVKDIQERFV